jgi:hypothetical protein
MTKRGTTSSTSTDPSLHMTAKRVKREEEQAAARPTVVVLHERINTDRLIQIGQLMLRPELERTVTDLLSVCDAGLARRQVCYAYASGMTCGRVYAQSPSLQGIKGSVRRLVGDFFDLDLENAAVVIASQVAFKTLGKVPKMVEAYAANRQYFYKQCRETHPHLTNNQLKVLFLACLHGGSHTTPETLTEAKIPFANWPTIAQPIPTLRQWEEAVKKMTNALWAHPDNSVLRKKVEARVAADETKTENQTKGSFLAFLWQTVENEIIQALRVFFTHAGYIVGVLSFDGLMIEWELYGPGQVSPVDRIDDAVAHVQEKLGFSIKLREKPSAPNQEDWQLYYGQKCIHKITGPFAKCVYAVSREGQINGLKRIGDLVFAPHKTILGVYVEKEKGSDFTNRVIRGLDFARVPQMMDKLLKWFETTDSDIFPLLTTSSFSKDAISFIDGFLNIQTLQFHQ